MTSREGARRQRPCGTLLRPLLIAVMTLGGMALGPVTAVAHPFGEPQTARISAAGSEVFIRWTSPPDDLLLLGGVVGALPSQRSYTFDLSPGAAPQQVGPSDAELITASPAVATYLAERLEVRQHGDVCAPEVALDQLVEEGALITFECAEPVTDVEIEITMLTDLNEAYRTIAIGDGAASPGRTLYTVDEPVHQWSFGASGKADDGVQLGGWIVIGAAAAGLGLGTWAWKRVKAGAS